MIEHILLIRWKEGASPEAIDSAMAELRALKEKSRGSWIYHPGRISPRGPKAIRTGSLSASKIGPRWTFIIHTRNTSGSCNNLLIPFVMTQWFWITSSDAGENKKNKGDIHMNGITMPDIVSYNRRRVLRNMANTGAAAGFATVAFADEQANVADATETTAVGPEGNTSFASLKQVEAGVLNIGYAEAGPPDGPVVILFHGWPYDIHSFVDVAPILAAAGYRVLVPYLRGYGTTRFLSDATPRNGQEAALVVDA